jgi:hypothetical protein
MKKLLFVAVAAIALTFASCSKEAKLNRSIDGIWNVTKIDGVAIPTDFTLTVEFSKEKKGKGTYKTTSTFGSISSTDEGTYLLDGDTKIYLTDKDGGKDTLNVVTYSKSAIQFKDNDDTIIDAEKK